MSEAAAVPLESGKETLQRDRAMQNYLSTYIVPWCKGNTAHFDCTVSGSNPFGTANNNIPDKQVH